MNKDKFIKLALITAIILLMVLVYISFINKVGSIKNPYYAVYLQTGDMYFGKLQRFPKFILSDAWFLQRNIQEEQGGFELIKFSNAMFGPTDKMEINKENIVWIAKLRDESDVVKFIQAAPQPSLPVTTTTIGE